MTGLRTSHQWARLAVWRQRTSSIGPLRVPLLASSLLVSACANFSPFGSGPTPPPPVQPEVQATNSPAVAPPVVEPAAPPPAPVVPPIGPKVGILLPLSGPNGSFGQGMLRAARLALSEPGSPLVDAHDTAAAGAAAAATLAVQDGDGIILGPLTSADTALVAPIARAANIPVLAFTSDVGQAQPGVWVMGDPPDQQVRRLVFAAKDEGRTRIAALLPSSPLGDALAAGLTQACADAGLAAPTILTHAGTRDSIDATMKQLSDYTTRAAAVDKLQTAGQAAGAGGSASVSGAVPGLTAQTAPAAPAASTYPLTLPMPPPSAAPATPPPPLPPPPFDALLLGDTGAQLQSVILALHETGVSAPQVRIMGPGLWSAFASKLHALAGAWYAAPDPSARLGFVQQYRGPMASHRSRYPTSHTMRPRWLTAWRRRATLRQGCSVLTGSPASMACSP